MVGGVEQALGEARVRAGLRLVLVVLVGLVVSAFASWVMGMDFFSFQGIG